MDEEQDDDWDDEELGPLRTVVLACMVVVATTAIVGVAVAWNTAAFAAQAVQAVRRKP
jgi:hypothetical protein